MRGHGSRKGRPRGESTFCRENRFTKRRRGSPRLAMLRQGVAGAVCRRGPPHGKDLRGRSAGPGIRSHRARGRTGRHRPISTSEFVRDRLQGARLRALAPHIPAATQRRSGDRWTNERGKWSNRHEPAGPAGAAASDRLHEPDRCKRVPKLVVVSRCAPKVSDVKPLPQRAGRHRFYVFPPCQLQRRQRKSRRHEAGFAAWAQAEQKPFQVRTQIDDLQPLVALHGRRVTPASPVLLDRIGVEQDECRLRGYMGPCLSVQPVQRVLHDRPIVPAVAHVHVEMDVETLLLAEFLPPLHERLVTWARDANEVTSSPRYRPPHGRRSAESGNTAQNAATVLLLKIAAATQPDHIS